MRSSIFIAAAVAASVLALAAARCPSACSGHGMCGPDDKCACYKNWQAADCADRTCEFGIAWAVEHTNDPHYYAECSAKGICDRATGECACFEGYTGLACKRSVCPNDCSGHGKCRLVQDLPLANTITYTQWDATKIQVCMCDGGYTGPDCSQRLCPRGDDPMTLCAEIGGGPLHVSVHTFTLVVGTGTKLFLNGAPGAGESFNGGSELAIHFKDTVGEEWITNRIEGVFSAATADVRASIKTALQALPNYRVPAVTVTYAAAGSSPDTRTFSVTFTDGRVSGDQNPIFFDNPLGCHVAGCHPMYRQPMWTKIVLGAETGVTVAGTSTDPVTEITVHPDSQLDFTVGGRYVACILLSISAAVGTSPATMPSHRYSVKWLPTDSAASIVCTQDIDLTKTNTPVAASAGVVTVPLPDNYLASDATGTTGGVRKVPIGHGAYLNFPATYYNAAFPTVTTSVAFSVAFEIASVSVTTNTVDVMNEDAECSNRGACDRTTGQCACYEGYYQDNCALQTILV